MTVCNSSLQYEQVKEHDLRFQRLLIFEGGPRTGPSGGPGLHNYFLFLNFALYRCTTYARILMESLFCDSCPLHGRIAPLSTAIALTPRLLQQLYRPTQCYNCYRTTHALMTSTTLICSCLFVANISFQIPHFIQHVMHTELARTLPPPW